ncbi:MAG: class I SAM-dependent methyltransferase [Thermoguttaceae bacterium]
MLSGVLLKYMASAPLPLAFERSVEAEIYSRHAFVPPVLDIGCGDGIFAHLVFDEPIDTGIDPNGREIESARQTGAYRELLQCNGDAIPKPDGSYQTIFSNSVLEHIADLEPVLRETHRLLAPGGRFYLAVPSDKYDHFTAINLALGLLGLKRLAARYRRFFNAFWRHYHYLPPAGWMELVRGCGFEVVECHSYGPRRMCVLDDLLVPLSLPSFLVKRATNRWVLFPSVRRRLLFPVYLVARKFLANCSKVEGGGLVFLVLTKSGEK